MGKPLFSPPPIASKLLLGGPATYPVLLLLLLAVRLQAVHPLCSDRNCTCEPNRVVQLINATCTFDSKRAVEVTANSLPDKLLELEIHGAKELRISPEAFTKTRSLQVVRIRKVGRVVFRRGAFLNLTTSNILLQLSDCGAIYMETDSLRFYRGHVSVEIARAGHVVFQKSAFHKLLKLTIRHVPCLELLENSFHLQAETEHLPTASVHLENVVIAELPRNTFPSALAELKIEHSEIRAIASEAINAIFLQSLRILNCSLHRLEAFALGTRMHIENMEIAGTRIRLVETNAVNSGISTFALRHSRLSEIQEAGFNATVATVILTNNTFDKIKNRGFSLIRSEGFVGSWRHMEVENNTFKFIDSNAFEAPYVISENANTGSKPVFVFKGNFVGQSNSMPVFNFSLIDDVNITIEDNYFGEACHCNMSTRMREVISGWEDIGDELYLTSKCTVTSFLSVCFKVPLGYMYMQNFTDVVCDADSIVCKEVPANKAEIPPHIPGISLDTLYNEDGVEREKQLLHFIFAFVVCGMCVMMLFSATMWLYRNEYFTKGRLVLLLSTESLLNMMSRMFNRSTLTRSDSTHSISRVSVHEYAELHGQKIQQDVDPDEMFPSEDKATQTLPEELTQELLQTLREKLDDPENYSEARDMIEHLYDLIKVEESCNQNCHTDAVINFEDFDNVETENHVYDEINPKNKNQARQQKDKKHLVSVGTRAPSPDKLLPMKVAYGEARRRSMMLGEYAEPRDKRESNQANEYSELPGGAAAQQKLQVLTPKPVLSPLRLISSNKLAASGKTDTPQNVYVELPHCALANRPLPKKPGQDDPGEGPSTSST